jgi:phosphoribosylformimino-5-aminoimidazole carboxamide ribotide isomerase
MKIVPVIDLSHGQVVHAVAGHRKDYRAIVSRLTPSCRPLDVARALRESFGFHELYIADLDAIAGSPPDLATLDALRDHGFACWVDAGVRDPHQATTLAQHAAAVIAGLESLHGPEDLAQTCEALGGRAIFSLDLKAGKPLGNVAGWPSPDPFLIARHAIQVGARRLIVLDLSRVGTSTGIGTEDVCSRIVKDYPHVELFAGGGIRTAAEIRRLAALGLTGVLIASALHKRTLTADDLSKASGAA